MKTVLWLMLLGVIVYFGYRRAHDYGLPWEDQVALVHYENSKRYRGGGEEVYVHGEVENRTRKKMVAEVECKTLPEGMTLTPKGRTSVRLEPLERMPFDVSLTTRREVTGAACKVSSWNIEDGLEAQVIRQAQHVFLRIKRLF